LGPEFVFQITAVLLVSLYPIIQEFRCGKLIRLRGVAAGGAKIERNEQGEVVEVDLGSSRITDTGLVHLKGLTSLQTLNLSGSITDSGLVHLKGLTNLQQLYLEDTQITDAGVADLQKALPNCKIYK